MISEPANTTATVTKQKYELITVEKVDAPSGMSGDDWYRYEIRSARSKIEGMQSGSLNAVKRYLEEYIQGLNERATGSSSPYAARSRKSKTISMK